MADATQIGKTPIFISDKPVGQFKTDPNRLSARRNTHPIPPSALVYCNLNPTNQAVGCPHV